MPNDDERARMHEIQRYLRHVILVMCGAGWFTVNVIIVAAIIIVILAVDVVVVVV